MKKFWTPRTTLVVVVFLTLCSIGANGIARTAELYVVLLGIYITCKLLIKEKV